jgi:DNA-binding transcriptional MerR regulator
MKSPDAFRTISEVAEELDLPQHVLRFWETRFAQIKPLKRGGGRRYYRPDDVLLLRGIRQLLYGEGYTIRGVQRILREQGVRYAVGLGGDAASLRKSTEAEAVETQPAEDDGRVEPRFEGDEAEAEARSDDDAAAEPAEDDEGEDDAGEGPRDAPAPLRALRFAPVATATAANDSAPAPVGRAPSAEAERRLRGVLSELLECKRLLERQ